MRSLAYVWFVCKSSCRESLNLTRPEFCAIVISNLGKLGKGLHPGELTEVDPTLFADKQNFSDLHFIMGV